MLLTALLVFDLGVFFAWAVLYVVLIGFANNDSAYLFYLNVHANYVSHAMATMRLIHMHATRRTHRRPEPWTYLMAVVSFALVLDVFNLIDTVLFTVKTSAWAWALGVALAALFVTSSTFMVVYVTCARK